MFGKMSKTLHICAQIKGKQDCVDGSGTVNVAADMEGAWSPDDG